MTDDKLAIRLSADLTVDRRKAFEIFVGQIGDWWPREHSVSALPMRTVVIEPRVGGRWYEESEGGAQGLWGKVLAFEPGERILLAWQLDGTYAYDPEFITEVEVRFTTTGASTCKVDFEHRGLAAYGEMATQMQAMLSSPEGWPTEIRNFAAVCAHAA